MRINTATPEGATVVQNIFIDQYMPHANGEFVKVYLYLLRCANTGRDLSISSIADVFEHTEKDVQRALIYWEKQHLIQLHRSADGSLTSVTMLDIDSESEIPDTEELIPETVPIVRPTESTQPARDRIAALREQKEIRQLFFIAEQYLKRPLTSSEQADFIYYYDTLQFSVDLIEYLLEYCISKGSQNRHYMRTVAHAWAEKGISTVIQAKQETNLYNKNYFTIMNAFGIKGRNPAPVEQEIMSRWLDTFGFTMDIILEACSRTIKKIQQPNFQYTDKILEQWYESNVATKADIEQLDKQHVKTPRTESAAPRQTKTVSGNRFNNFPQREYDYAQLEKKLNQP